tara:strand:- start:250 stop:966 length:717 start_codon:yes stop_codon:yes gene_type:complete
MTLPKVDVPTYELTLPSEDKKVKFRPFLVKEEKILFVAMESKNNAEMVNAVKEIISACTFNTLNVDSLPLFDIEYLFLNIRAKSVGEVADFKVICPDDNKTYADVKVDLSKVEVHVDEDHTNKIVVDENRKLGMVLRYPTLKNYTVGKDINTNDVDNVFTVLIDCVDHIFEGDKIYPAKDATPEEIKEFVETMTQDSFVKIKKFFDTMPKLKQVIEVENPNTKVKSTVTLQGLQDFFG